MEKRMQIFVSSTFIDLINERQHAVQAILNNNHIPAGMELFKAGNDDQLTVIKRWIDESDIYMLILGGRYGTIEPKSGKSYTHIEYEYAIEKEKPVFTLILDDTMLENKFSALGKEPSEYEKVYEKSNIEKYQSFKNQVSGHNKTVSYPVNVNDLQYQTVNSINEIVKRHKLDGWVKAFDSEILKENEELKEEIQKLKQSLEQNPPDKLITSSNNNEIGEIQKLIRLNKGKQSFLEPIDKQLSLLDHKIRIKNTANKRLKESIIPNTNLVGKHTFNEIKNSLSNSKIQIKDTFNIGNSSDFTRLVPAIVVFTNKKTLEILHEGIRKTDENKNSYNSMIIHELIPILEQFDLIDINEFPNFSGIYGGKSFFYSLNANALKFLTILDKNPY